MAKTGISHHYHQIRKHALRHKQRAVQSFHATHKHAKGLLRKHRVVLEKIRHHSVKSATLAGVSAGMLAVPVISSAVPQQVLAQHHSTPLARQLIKPVPSAQPTPLQTYGPDAKLASLAGIVPEKISSIAPNQNATLTPSQEAQFTLLIQQVYHVNATAELEGVRLNTSHGLIAGEQHLPLYPGDTLENHTSDPTRNLTGMVPGLPSWGYFAPNRQSVTQADITNERYYMALQTFLTPGWQGNYEHLYSWFKYRKMIVINPETGQAVVTDVGDAGPSPYTGRAFGGSNETLIGLGLGTQRVGNVYVFFVDDPSNSIPLGPIGAQ